MMYTADSVLFLLYIIRKFFSSQFFTNSQTIPFNIFETGENNNTAKANKSFIDLFLKLCSNDLIKENNYV